MRWPEKRSPKDGDRRHRRGFLFWPKCIAHEWRWLEWAEWTEEYWHRSMFGWHAVAWRHLKDGEDWREDWRKEAQ